MKCATLFLVMSMVVLMAQPGECFFGLIVKGIGHAINGIRSLIHRKGKVAEEQADQQQLNQQQRDQEQLDQKQLDQQQLDQDQLDQDKQDEQQLDQDEQDQQQFDKRSFEYQSAHRRFD